MPVKVHDEFWPINTAGLHVFTITDEDTGDAVTDADVTVRIVGEDDTEHANETAEHDSEGTYKATTPAVDVSSGETLTLIYEVDQGGDRQWTARIKLTARYQTVG